MLSKPSMLLRPEFSDFRSDESALMMPGAGDSLSTLDYASFVMGELQELGEGHSELDFATSIASDSPFPRLELTTPLPPAAPATTINCTEIESYIKYHSDSVFTLYFLWLISQESDMTTFVDTPLPPGYEAGFPSTPLPGQNDYLPSPPITPVYKRAAVKIEDLTSSQAESLAGAWDNPSHPNGSPVATVKQPRARVVSQKVTPRITKIRSKTPATAKLSIRRKLAKSHTLSPSQGRPTSLKNKATASPSPPTPKAPKIPKSKAKTESDMTILNTHPFLQTSSRPKQTKSRAQPKFVKPSVRSKKMTTILAKNRSRGRITNNSLSTTLHPIIAKRKGIRTRIPGPGKICSSYYPSDRKLVPHPAGERYHKGLPYLPLPIPS